MLDFDLLRTPPAAYRSAPFWSWNGDMEEERVVEQLSAFYQAGMGGAYIHSRSGLKTPYMEEKWLSCVRAAVERAKQEGRKVYLYDEDRYSSGFAGGGICREHPEYRLRHLMVATAPDPEGDTLAVFAVRRSAPERVTDYRRLRVGEKATAEEETLYFQIGDFVRNPAWHNDSHPVDLCNPEAVDAFLASTHEVYAAACGEDFGDTIPAIFTDEVCLSVLPSGKHSEAVLANHHWTRGYDRLFAARFGYDFTEYLPELFFAVDNPRKPTLAADYLTGIADLFAENYSHRVADWCTAHHLALTGHLNFASFLDFARVGNPLAHFRYWQWPGMDILTDQVAKLPAFKITASAAHQYGDGRVVCETYGCTGWDWAPERHRFHGGWQFCMGVNFRCQHLSHYTLAGWGKKDYPASISPHSPWFADYPQLEDHYARVSYALTQGTYAAHTLVLAPYSAVISRYKGNHFGNTDPAGEELAYLNAVWTAINQALIEAQIDFDYGDEETVLSAPCADGKLTVGQMTYDTLLVLPGHTPDAALTARLEAAGVRVIALKEESIPADVLSALTADYRITVEGQNAPEIWATCRRDGNHRVLFLQNMADTSLSITVTLEEPKDVVLVEELTGDLVSLPVSTAGTFTLTLPARGNALLLCGYGQSGKALPTPLPEREICPSGPYLYTLCEPNTLPLDTVQVAFGDGAWSAAMSISEAEERIRQRYGLPSQQFYNTAQPWYIHRHQYKAYEEVCSLRCTFSVAALPSICMLALEGYPQFERVDLNGAPVPSPTGYLIDHDLQTCDIASLLRIGENTLELHFRYTTDTELENLVLAGTFGVTPLREGEPLTADNLQLTVLPPVLTGGTWAENGLPFYTGRLRYRYIWQDEGTPCYLDLSGMQALCCAIEHNGQRVARLCPPFVFDLSSTVKSGENELILELVPGRKNLFGPLHVERVLIVEPDDFRYDNPHWQEPYALHTFGLMTD